MTAPPARARLQLRPAAPADVKLVFGWANDPVTRRSSFQPTPIPWDDHHDWYTASLARDDRHLLVAEEDGEPVGFVRFDALGRGGGDTEIGVNVAPTARGRGLGTRILEAATAEAAALGFTSILARIRPSNTASIRAFERSGYTLEGRDMVHGEAALRYRRSCADPSSGRSTPG